MRVCVKLLACVLLVASCGDSSGFAIDGGRIDAPASADTQADTPTPPPADAAREAGASQDGSTVADAPAVIDAPAAMDAGGDAAAPADARDGRPDATGDGGSDVAPLACGTVDRLGFPTGSMQHCCDSVENRCSFFPASPQENCKEFYGHCRQTLSLPADYSFCTCPTGTICELVFVGQGRQTACAPKR